MTVGEIMKRQAYLMDPSTGDQESDYGLFAVGRYQIIPAQCQLLLDYQV